LASLRIVGLWKKYGSIIALRDVNLEVNDGELVTILGPSGAGKTSLLQTIAGVEEVTSGEVYIDGKLVNKLPPAERDIAMVFETYALYPNKTVFENLAFPLLSPLRKLNKSEVEKRVKAVAQLLQIDTLLDRNVAQLSGGQRQRVALGRMLVREPKLFLMDEPIAHLDAKLRHRLRGELKHLQKHIGTTTLYTTHDYREALGMGDKVVVLNKGVVLQVGTPDEVYHKPKNAFVGSLIGDPPMNLFDGEIVAHGDKLWVQTKAFTSPIDEEQAHVLESKRSKKVKVGLRPSDLILSKESKSLESKGFRSYTAKIYVVEPLGVTSIVSLEKGGLIFQAKYKGEEKFLIDETVYFAFRVEDLYFFDPLTEENLLTRQGWNRKWPGLS